MSVGEFHVFLKRALLIEGRLLKVRVGFVCVYAPTRAAEREVSLEEIKNINHVEPHMLSLRRLTHRMQVRDLSDVWRNFHREKKPVYLRESY